MTAVANHVPLSPLTFLARARRAFGPETAVIDTDGTTVTYHELGRDCDALAGALRADAVQAGDRVAVLDLNSRWLLAAHYGVPGARAALVAVPPGNSIVSLTCLFACTAGVMMVG